MKKQRRNVAVVDSGMSQQMGSESLAHREAWANWTTGPRNNRKVIGDLIITHSPFGEYTRHLMHEETGRGGASLRQSGALTAEALWLFA